MKGPSRGVHALEALGRDLKVYAKRVRLRRVFVTVLEFSVEKRRGLPDRGHGDVEAAQRSMRSCCGDMKLRSSYAGKGPGHHERGLGFPLKATGSCGSESLANDLGLSSPNWVQVLRSWNSLFCGILTRVQLLPALHPLPPTCSPRGLLQPAGAGRGHSAKTPRGQHCILHAPGSRARISGSCPCFPREPRHLPFGHVELVEICHSFRLRLIRLSGFLGKNSSRLRS